MCHRTLLLLFSSSGPRSAGVPGERGGAGKEKEVVLCL